MVHSLSYGGMEKGLVSLLNSPCVDPDQHVVCTMRQPGPLADALPDAVALEALNINRASPFAAIRLARIIRAVRPDIIHARNFNSWTDTRLAAAIACRTQMKTVFGFHGLEDHNGFSAKQRRRARHLRFGRVQYTAVSNAGRGQLSQELKIPDDQITILRNGIDTDKFAPVDSESKKEIRAKLGIANDAFVIVTVASIVPVKNHFTMLRAVANGQSGRQKYTWLVVGDGAGRRALMAAAREHANPPDVIFMGNQTDVRPYLHAADVFMLASKYEQMSIALLEAMASGIPVIVTNVGDHAEIVRHGVDGLVIQPCDIHGLSVAIRRLAEDGNTRIQMGASARVRIADEFSFKHAANKYVDYYNSIFQESAEALIPCAASPASSRITA